MFEPQQEFTTGKIKAMECYREAWEMVRGQYLMVFAVVIVGMIVGSLIPLIILGPMVCGIYLCLFDMIDGKPISFDKLFKGFDFFLPSFLLTLLIMVPIVIMVILIYIPLIGVAIAGQRMSQDELLWMIIGMLGVELVFAVIMTIIHTLVIFSFPLIVDRKAGAWEAITLSARAVWANKGGVGALFGIGFLLAILGYLALCVGIYLVIPIIITATAVAYRKVFPPLAERFSSPPPPEFYDNVA
ncbi:MAG: hypothetical protein IPM21_16465 [Acidobacteria bacterium]|nr:hypothetical protein [Acidobacteriota bacterium]